VLSCSLRPVHPSSPSRYPSLWSTLFLTLTTNHKRRRPHALKPWITAKIEETHWNNKRCKNYTYLEFWYPCAHLSPKRSILVLLFHICTVHFFTPVSPFFLGLAPMEMTITILGLCLCSGILSPRLLPE